MTLAGIRGPSPSPLAEIDLLSRPRARAGSEEGFVAPIGRLQFQETIGSCVPHGFTKSLENIALAQGIVAQISRADVYSGCLLLDGNPGRDVGTYLSTCARWCERGVLSEWQRPYDPATALSPTNASLDAERVKGASFSFLPKGSEEQILAALDNGRCVPFGHPVHRNFDDTARDGWWRPSDGTRPSYHVEHIVGHSDFVAVPGFANGAFLVENSWRHFGVEHPLAASDLRFAHLRGLRGYSWLPYQLVLDGFIFDATYIESGLDLEA